jgi:WS/DGAT/MGAT family acyltransferase
MSHLERTMFSNQAWPPATEMPAAASVINGCIFIKQLPQAEALRDTVMKAFLRFPRLSSLATPNGEWQPIEATSLDVSQHFVSEAPVSAESELHTAVERVMLQPLSTDRPLWKVHTVPNSGDGLSMIIFRIHHSVGDGVHLSQVLMELVTDTDGRAIEGEDARAKFEEFRKKMAGAGCCAKCTTSAGKCACAVPAFFSNVAHTSASFESETVFQRPAEERKLLKFSGSRRVLFVPPHSLKFVKACKDSAKVSVNDVLMGATAGAIRRYCEARGDPLFQADQVASVILRALVPVTLPKEFPPGQDRYDVLCNNWCFCSSSLAVGEVSPLTRIKATSQEMGKLKRSMKPIMALWSVENVIPLLPLSAAQDTTRDLFARHSMVFSNVPGPQQTMVFAGEPVVGMQAVFLNAIPQVILTSYEGRIWMNIVVDPNVVGDVEGFGQFYIDELAALGKELGVSGGPLDF